MIEVAPPAIDVIVCAYTLDRWSDLGKAIASLRGQSLAPARVVLVIDHNDTLLTQAQAAFPDVTVLANSGPRGLSGARNTGMAQATAPIVAFMDEDAQAAPDWLARLAAGYADEHVLGVGGAIVPAWATGRPAWFPNEFDWVVGCTYRGMPTTRQPVRNLIGCNMSFRRSFAQEAGGFRDGMGRIGTVPIGCEETELCIRLQQRRPNGRFLFDPAARVAHHVPASRSTGAYFRSRCYAEGLSKAQVAHFVGAADGLSNERGYATRTLPAGMVRHALRALRDGRPAQLGRSFMIPVGLLLTTAGYLRGQWAQRQAAKRPLAAPEWRPDPSGPFSPGT